MAESIFSYLWHAWPQTWKTWHHFCLCIFSIAQTTFCSWCCIFGWVSTFLDRTLHISHSCSNDSYRYGLALSIESIQQSRDLQQLHSFMACLLRLMLHRYCSWCLSKIYDRLHYDHTYDVKHHSKSHLHINPALS